MLPLIGAAIWLGHLGLTPGAAPNEPRSLTREAVKPSGPTADAANSERLREGTKLMNELGSFERKGGDRLSFRIHKTKREFACLENLNLERIAAAVADTPDLEWLVSGTVTEFRGTNCLLVTQAVLKTKVVKPTGP
jgi:hypothetical protein